MSELSPVSTAASPASGATLEVVRPQRRLRRGSRAAGCLAQRATGAHRRADRSERRRQEHAAQLRVRLTRPTTGTVGLGDVELTGRRPDQIVGLGIGRVFQHPQVIAEFSVLDNLLVVVPPPAAFPGARRDARPALVRRAEDAARAEAVDVADPYRPDRQPRHADRQPALRPSQAARTRPRDADGRPGAAARRTDRGPQRDARSSTLPGSCSNCASARGLSILLVEHNMGLVRRLCDRAVVLDAGSGDRRRHARRRAARPARAAGLPRRGVGEDVDVMLEIDGLRSTTGRSARCARSRCGSAEGQMVGILGANGAGKTSLLRTISGCASAGARARFVSTDTTSPP